MIPGANDDSLNSQIQNINEKIVIAVDVDDTLINTKDKDKKLNLPLIEALKKAKKNPNIEVILFTSYMPADPNQINNDNTRSQVLQKIKDAGLEFDGVVVTESNAYESILKVPLGKYYENVVQKGEEAFLNLKKERGVDAVTAITQENGPIGVQMNTILKESNINDEEFKELVRFWVQKEEVLRNKIDNFNEQQRVNTLPENAKTAYQQLLSLQNEQLTNLREKHDLSEEAASFIFKPYFQNTLLAKMNKIDKPYIVQNEEEGLTVTSSLEGNRAKVFEQKSHEEVKMLMLKHLADQGHKKIVFFDDKPDIEKFYLYARDNKGNSIDYPRELGIDLSMHQVDIHSDIHEKNYLASIAQIVDPMAGEKNARQKDLNIEIDILKNACQKQIDNLNENQSEQKLKLQQYQNELNKTTLMLNSPLAANREPNNSKFSKVSRIILALKNEIGYQGPIDQLKETEHFKELITTETTYLNQLKLLQENRAQILKSFPRRTHKGEMKAKDLNEAYNLLPELIKAHQNFLNSLSSSDVREWEKAVKAIESPAMKYAINFDKLTESKIPLLVNQKVASLSAKNLDLMSLLITPVQRPPRIIMLFNGLKKITAEKINDSSDLQTQLENAAKTTGSIVGRINEEKRAAEILMPLDKLIEDKLKEKKIDQQAINDLINVKGILTTQLEKKQDLNIDTAISQLRSEKERQIQALQSSQAIPELKTKFSKSAPKTKKSKQASFTNPVQKQLNSVALETSALKDSINKLSATDQRRLGRSTEKVPVEVAQFKRAAPILTSKKIRNDNITIGQKVEPSVNKENKPKPR